MAKRISKKDLGIEDDLLAGLNKQLKETIANTKKYEAEQQRLTSVNKLAIAGIKEYIKLLKQQNVTTAQGQKEFTQKSKEAQTLILNEEKIKQAQLRTNKLIEQSKQAELRTQKMINATKEKALTLYQKESKSLTDNRNKWKELALQNKQNTKEGRELLRTITAQDKALTRIDKSVGQNFRSFAKYENAIGKVRGAMMQLGATFGAFELIRGSVNIIKDFDEASANMAKTLNISIGEAKLLSHELLNIDTRTAVTELQNIATIGGQLGISASEIVGFTESVDKLNVALGDEFTGGAEEITTVIGGLRNVLTDIKTGDVSADLLKIGNAINLLGASGNATAPIVSDFAGRISGIAVPLGVSTQEILGLSATLQELGVNSERGGTAVGRIFQEIAKNTEGFAKVAGVPVNDFTKLVNEDLFGAFKKVLEGSKQFKGDNVALTKTLDSLGLSGSGASEVFLKLSGSMGLLNEKVDLTGEGLSNLDSITAEFNAKNNTLGASFEKLNKEFQKFVLGIDEAGNVSGNLGGSLNFLINNFARIVSVVMNASAVYLIFIARKKILNSEILKSTKGIGLFNGGLKNMVTNLKEGARAGTGMGGALVGIGWSMLIGAALALANELYQIASGARQAEEDLNRMNKTAEKALESVSKNISKIKNDLKEQLTTLENKYKIDLSKAKSELEKTKIQKEYLANVKKETQETQLQLTNNRKLVMQRKEGYREHLEALKALRIENSQAFATAGDEDEAVKAFKSLGMNDFRDFGGAISVNSLRDAMAQLRAQINGADIKIKEYNISLAENGNELKTVATDVEVLDNETKKVTRSTNNHTEALKEQKRAYNDVTDAINRRFDAEDELEDIQSSFKFEQMQRDNDAFIDAEIKKAEETGKVNSESIKKRLKEEEEFQQKIIEIQFSTDLQGAKSQEEIDLAYEKRRQATIKLEQSYADKTKTVLTDLETAQENYADKVNKLAEDEIEKEKKKQEDIQGYIETTTAILEKNIDRRIELLDREIEANEKQQDMLRELAQNGNILAQQSLAESLQQQRIAEVEKLKQERRKQQLEIVNTFLTSYGNHLEAGDNSATAFSKAFTEKATLEAIVASLPAFLEGTEDTGKVSNALDSNGGRLAVLHDNERVLTKEQNFAIGSISNDEAVSLIQKGKIIDSIEGANSGNWQQLELLNSLNGLKTEMREVKKAIENKPVTTYDVEGVVHGVMKLNKTTIAGNSIIHNKFRIK